MGVPLDFLAHTPYSYYTLTPAHTKRATLQEIEMTFAIETGVGIPARSRGRKPTEFPLGDMPAPDGSTIASFLIPFEDGDDEKATAKLVESWRRKLRTFEKSQGDALEGMKFDTARVPGGLRVYRTK